MPLTQLIQEDFSAGMVTAVAAHLVPATGLTEVINSLLDDDGSLYRRGGSQYKSGAAFGSGGLRWMWDGVLLAGRRTLVANSSQFGVLAADDSTVVALGGSGLSAPVRAWQFRDMVLVDGGTVYGGSRKAADYSTGTLAVTAGDPQVTGAGTAFLANADAGMLLRIGGGRFYVVKSVDTDTGITLTDPYEGSTAAGLAYTLSRLGTLSSPYRVSQMYALVGKRLVALDADRIYEAEYNNPDAWDPTAFHDLPGVGQILGAQPVRNTLLVFSTTGVWAISNMELDLTDFSGGVQQSLAQVSGDLFLWGSAGNSSWKGTPIVPALDGVWMFDGISEPQLLSRAIAPTYRAYVRAGHKPGLAAVYQAHYFLPILNASNVLVDLLVCRLDRPTGSAIGEIFPWTRMRGHGGKVTALTVRAEEAIAPTLLAAGEDGRVLDLTSFFVPDGAVKLEADGTVPVWRVETRDFTTSDRRNRNHVRRLKAQYESRDAGTDDPQITGYYSVGADVAGQTLWGAFLWGEASWGDASLDAWTQLAGTAPEDDGRTPHTWNLATFTRRIRARLESSEPTANLVLRSLAWAVREQGGDR